MARHQSRAKCVDREDALKRLKALLAIGLFRLQSLPVRKDADRDDNKARRLSILQDIESRREARLVGNVDTGAGNQLLTGRHATRTRQADDL